MWVSPELTTLLGSNSTFNCFYRMCEVIDNNPELIEMMDTDRIRFGSSAKWAMDKVCSLFLSKFTFFFMHSFFHTNTYLFLFLFFFVTNLVTHLVEDFLKFFLIFCVLIYIKSLLRIPPFHPHLLSFMSVHSSFKRMLKKILFLFM